LFLYQPTKGYAYNSDSIFLYDFIHRLKPKGKLLDIGCGVGIISLLLTRDFKIETTIIDKQKIMLKYAKLNYTLNALGSESYLGDFMEYSFENSFDYIISNPPFYDSSVTQSENENINIARYSHHLPIDKFIKKVKSILRPRGRFVFCYDAKQVDKLLYTLVMNKINPEILRFVHSKVDRESKLVMISARANSKSMMRVLPPLVVFDNKSKYLDESKEAFIRASTYSIKGDYTVE